MREDIRTALIGGNRLQRHTYTTARGLYTETIIEKDGMYYVEKRKDGIVVEAKCIQTDLDHRYSRSEVERLERENKRLHIDLCTLCGGAETEICDSCEWR